MTLESKEEKEIIVEKPKEIEYLVKDLEQNCYRLFGIRHHIFVGAMEFGKLKGEDKVTKTNALSLIEAFRNTPVKN